MRRENFRVAKIGNEMREVLKMAKEKDLVCGMQIETSESVGQSDYQGRTYYFCSSACKEQFDANPARFTENEPENQ